MNKTDVDVLLGEDSYNSVIKQISDKISNCQAQTLNGTNFLNEMYKKLNESETPMLDLKPFITGAESVSSNDASVKEVIDFCKKSILNNSDLNFIINMCKEEHFASMRRDNHPFPKETIRSIEKEFNKPSGELVQLIRKGLFDSLKSDFLVKVKNTLMKDVDVKQQKNLNENNQYLFSDIYERYAPVGIIAQNMKNGENVLLCENDVFSFKDDNFVKLNKNEVQLSPGNHLLMESVSQCLFNPETSVFKLNEQWDFEMILKADGNVSFNGKDMKKEHVQQMLLESIQLYEVNMSKRPSDYSKDKYLKDADRFVCLCENSDLLTRVNELEVVRNTQTNSYAIFNRNKNNPNPQIVGSNLMESKVYPSYMKMVEECRNALQINDKKLFESIFSNELNDESYAISEMNKEMMNLNEEQKELNTAIKDVEDLLKIAEPDSPAHAKLNTQKEQLNISLNENIQNMNNIQKNLKSFYDGNI